jgi:hypothetical protein
VRHACFSLGLGKLLTWSENSSLPLAISLYRCQSPTLTEPNTVVVPLRPRRRGDARAWITAIVAVLVLASVFFAGNVLTRPVASAATPPLLTSSPVDGTLEDVLERLSVAAQNNQNDTPSHQRSIVYETWSANITVGEDKTVDIFVQPQEIERTWSDDLSGRIVTRAGAVKWGEQTEAATAAEPGTVLDDGTFGPGEYPALFPATPPASAGEMRTYLSSVLGLTGESTAGEWFKAIQDLRVDWPLTGAQTSALIQIIKTLPDVAVAGTVTDRLGRQGVALETETREGGNFKDILVFDSATGLLLSAEDVYLGGLEDIDLPAMTVLSYTAWKEPNR